MKPLLFLNKCLKLWKISSGIFSSVEEENGNIPLFASKNIEADVSTPQSPELNALEQW